MLAFMRGDVEKIREILGVSHVSALHGKRAMQYFGSLTHPLYIGRKLFSIDEIIGMAMKFIR